MSWLSIVAIVIAIINLSILITPFLIIYLRKRKVKKMTNAQMIKEILDILQLKNEIEKIVLNKVQHTKPSEKIGDLLALLDWELETTIDYYLEHSIKPFWWALKK